MKIAIIGAGAVGVTTAHALNKTGFEVQVFELGSSAAQGASFAHGGVFGSASAQPFFSPKFTQHWALSLLGRPKNIHWAMLSKASDYALGIKAAWKSRRSVYQATAQDLGRLAAYSAGVGAEVLLDTRLECEQGSGLMVLHSHVGTFEAASLQAKALNFDRPRGSSG
jgi:D-amino-acid dehydrogenase